MNDPILPNSTPVPEARVVTVTPEMARDWIDNRNKQNRSVSKARVTAYARDMAAGRWMFTNQAIGFDVNGKLSDGQHRLYACIESGVAFETLVVTNMDPEAQAKVDTGRARTPGDMLAVLDGVTNANNVAAIAKLAITWDKGHRLLSSYKPTHQEIREYVSNTDNTALLARAAEVGNKSRRFVPVRTALIGIAYYICARINYADAETFYVEQLIEGIGLQPNDPAKTLQTRLVQDSDKQSDRADFGKLAYMLTAWNRFRRGEKISKLQAPRGGGWSLETFPVPK